MSNWTTEKQPFGPNRAPLLSGLASDGSDVAIPVAVDPTTGRLLVNATGSSGGTSSTFGAAFPTLGTAVGASDGTNMQPLLVDGSGYLEVNVKSGGGGGTQYTDAGTSPTHPIGNALEWNNAGTWATVGSSAPMPVTANAGTNLNTSSLATSTNITGGGQKTQIVDGSGNVIASTSNSLNVNVTAAAATLPVQLSDLVDSGNSSTATLTGGSTFTGTGHTTVGYGYIMLYIYADQNSATGGVTIQFSSDNSNFNDASTWTFTAGGSAPNNGQVFGTAARGQYYRVVYTNGATNQGAFRLQAVLKSSPAAGDMVPLSVTPLGTEHGLLTKSSIVGLSSAGGGSFVDVKVNPSGSLQTNSSTNDGAGTAITSNSTTTTATTGLDMNIRSILNTAPTTAGFLDIKGADGNVFVRQATAANLNATVVGTGTFAVQATNSVSASATGASISLTTAFSTSLVPVKASAGNLYGYHIYNPNSVVAYVQLFNLGSGSVTLGSTTPTAVLVVPANGGLDTQPGLPIGFGTAITAAATTTATGSTALASSLVANFWYA
jgi:hypothetical protein